jgi:hypothetical protein
MQVSLREAIERAQQKSPKLVEFHRLGQRLTPADLPDGKLFFAGDVYPSPGRMLHVRL